MQSNTTVRIPVQDQPVTRFAPGPTGFLHLGHVASAIFVWGIGRRLGARVLLRIEDHDRGRSRPEFEQAIFADLEWLGFVHDNDIRPDRASSFRQSDNRGRYEQRLRELATRHLVYGCRCTRKAIRSATHAGPDEEPCYPGTCRTAGIPADSAGTAARLILPADQISFPDGLLGDQRQTPALQCGDLLLRDRDGNFSYQFAVAIDDLDQGVNLIIRGQDILASTGRQILTARLLGRHADASFVHHPLISDASGRKLGKRFFSEAIARRREAGEDPAAVLGEAAWLAGLTPTADRLRQEDLSGLFQVIS